MPVCLYSTLERIVRSSSNAESALFQSYFAYFYVTRHSHVSGGTFVFVTPLLVLLIALPVSVLPLLLLLVWGKVVLPLIRQLSLWCCCFVPCCCFRTTW